MDEANSMDCCYGYYPYTYDRSLIRTLLESHLHTWLHKFAWTRNDAIGSVHNHLGLMQKKELKRAQSNSITEGLDPALAKWLTYGFNLPPAHFRNVRVLFMSPSKAYMPSVAAGYDLAECMTQMTEFLEGARQQRREEFLDPDIIDDPVWCLWSDALAWVSH